MKWYYLVVLLISLPSIAAIIYDIRKDKWVVTKK